MDAIAKPPVTSAVRPMRADALRNRERVLRAAGELFAMQGRDACVEDIAQRAGVGVGTIYRQFPTKNALLTAMVQHRFSAIAEIAREVEATHDGPDALTVALRSACEATAGDKGFQLGAMGWDVLDWEQIEPALAELGEVMDRLIDRGVAAGVVRADLTFDDIGLLMCGVTAVMYFKPAQAWRRHLEFLLSGLRP